jgi:hypothetical protein
MARGLAHAKRLDGPASRRAGVKAAGPAVVQATTGILGQALESVSRPPV